MSRTLLRAVTTLVLVMARSSVSLAADAFPKMCAPPFKGKWRRQNVDRKRPPQGKVAQNQSAEKIARHEEQNRAKNNICPSGSEPAVSFQTFTGLQAAVDGAGFSYAE